MNSVREEDIRNIISRIPYEKCEGKTFLITGAAGFLARYMTDTLMYMKKKAYVQKCTVLALCRNREKAKQTFGDWLIDEDFHLLIQPVEEEITYRGNIDYIIHAASGAATRMFEKSPVDIIKANAMGTYNLLETARQKQTNGFLFFSSGAVYGEISDDVLDIKEEDCFPLDFTSLKNCYAEGKRSGEALCRAYWQQYGIPTVSVRISHTYGPGIDIDDGHVFSDFVKSILNRTDLVIKGDGMDVRPFCYVTDAVTAFFILLFKGNAGDAYNMANSAETYSIKELADRLVSEAFAEKRLKVTGESIKLGEKPKKNNVNTEKLESLGWKPEVNVVKGFRRTVDSFEL